jgi:Asp-tRNA(Asn)/Glu-tRNA(Gln) amidotransferase A subunit family amidase
MDAPGWIARTVDDLAFLWPLTGLRGGPSTGGPRRVGLLAEVDEDDVAPQIRAAMSASAAGLVAAGHTLVPVRAGMAWLIRGIAWELCAREAWDGYLRWRDFIVDDLTEPTRLALEVGQGVCDQRYEDIRDAQVRARADVAGWFDSQRVDAWLLPLDPDLPRRRDAPPPDRTIPSARHDRYDRTIGYTPLASFLGLPAITVPFGRTPDDAPLAMQLVGPAHSEWSLLQLGRDLAASAGNLDLALR